MSPQPVTGTTRDVLDTIRAYITEHGYPPTVRDLCEIVGVRSTSTIAHHMTVLEARGWITREAGQPRTLVLADPPPEDEPSVNTITRQELADALVVVVVAPDGVAQTWTDDSVTDLEVAAMLRNLADGIDGQ